MNSAIATTNNLRPEQKLQDHTEYPRHEDQFPSARTHPSPDRLPRSLESPQHVIHEKEKASQRRQLVTIAAASIAPDDSGYDGTQTQEIRNSRLAVGPPCGSFPHSPPPAVSPTLPFLHRLP